MTRIFATVGTRIEPFDRMVRMIDDAIEAAGIEATGLLQYGSCIARSRHLENVEYVSRSQFESELRDADIVICHGGIGSMYTATSVGQRPLVVPRLVAHGEHVSDDTVVTGAVAGLGIIGEIHDTETLSAELKRYVAGEYDDWPTQDFDTIRDSIRPVGDAIARGRVRRPSRAQWAALKVLGAVGPSLKSMRRDYS